MSKLETKYLIERGFRRFRCKKCGSYFWSIVERDTCGDAPCEPYGFIGNSPVKIKLEDLNETRERYLKYFEKRGHVRIPKYPVVALRWRDDVYLVGASIYVFQPWVTSGIVPPPANPLVISQPCIRFTDIDIVGRSGRHLTGFEMMAHHAFNYPDKSVYWIEETVQLAHEFFTKELGIPEEEIVYKESTWIGGGNAGECFEVLVRGLEIATLVFMHYKTRPDGTFEEMNMKIVDTGYGLERIYWLSTGLPNVYEATFRGLLDRLRSILGIEKPDEKLLSQICILLSQLGTEDIARIDIYDRIADRIGVDANELKKIITQQEAIYTIADHARSLSWMVYDGVLPSNSGIGYLARLLIRRILRYLEILKIDTNIEDLLNTCLKWLVSIYPELKDIENVIIDIAVSERDKFRSSLNQAKSQIEKIIKKKSKVTTEDFIKIYDAYGIPPEIIIEILKDKKIDYELPSNLYSLLAERKKEKEVFEESEKVRIEKDLIEEFQNIPKTKEIFYENQYIQEFTSNVVRVIKKRDRHYIVLRETAFYPEGGGQPSDRGILLTESGVKCHVDHVFKIGNVIVHECRCDGDIKEGDIIRGIIDWNRRYSLMKMHTGTHILLQACRRILGSHIWQAGVQKDTPFSRLDITHYKLLSDDEIRKIEDLANEIIEKGFNVVIENLVRTEAEIKYGVRIYQGGIIPSPIIRIVKIVDNNGEIFDVQACAGTHVGNTSEVNILKIVRVERLQEGIIRIIFTTSKYVLEYLRGIENRIRQTSHILKCSDTEIVDRIRRILEEYDKCYKKCRILERYLVENILQNVRIENINGIDVLLLEIPEEISEETIQTVARDVTSKFKTLLIVSKTVKDRSLVYTFSSNDVAKIITMRDLIREICRRLNGRGGGSTTYGQAVFNTVIDLNNLLTIVRDVLSKAV